MSLEKCRLWMRTEGRVDVSEGRSERELEVLGRVFGIAMDLDGVVPHQGAKAGKGAEQHDLAFGRMVKGRKTPVLFAGVLFQPRDRSIPWARRNDMNVPDAVRVYVKLTPEGVRRSGWQHLFHDDDSLKPEPGWRYVEIPGDVSLHGEELLDILEDAYFEAGGI